MAIKSIRLENFKGFKNAGIDLKPLTVLIGPNSAGKSSFGQALVALSKSHEREKNTPLNLMFDDQKNLMFDDQKSSINFGNYSELVHAGCESESVKIELGLTAGKLCLGFGAGNLKTNIRELDLVDIEIGRVDKKLNIHTLASDVDSTATTNVIETSLTKYDYTFNDFVETSFRRQNEQNWAIGTQNSIASAEHYEILFNGMYLSRIFRLTGTSIDPTTLFKKTLFDDAAYLLEKVVYLRPDRMAPRRKDWNVSSSSGPKIDDWGNGVSWYIHEHGDVDYVSTFKFPKPTIDKNEAGKILHDYSRLQAERIKLSEALCWWLSHLGLASSFETKFLDGEQAIQTLATPPGQNLARPLTDLGFGVSQVLPIIVRGLTLEKDGLLVVEQPEAQLHPKPQAELADFFCSMIKCGRNVIVETHSEELFHRLRLRASMDSDLAEKIGVYFFHESVDGSCCQPERISLNEEAELKWPKGFLPEGVKNELEILAMRLARKESGN